MGTFVEFYITLLGFVNFRLYTSIGLIYPPRFNAKSDEQGGELGAFTLEGRGIEEPKQIESVNGYVNGEVEGETKPTKPNEGTQKQIAAIEEGPDAEQDVPQGQGRYQAPDQEINDAIDTFETTGDDADVLPQPQASGNEIGSLFAPFTFFLSRETPRQPLELILRAFGCKRIGFDGILGNGAFTNNEADPTITHQIVDRPPMASLPEEPQASESPSGPSSTTVIRPGHRVPGRTYIQPQWVWDCMNEVKLLRPDLYGPGATLPPHLSPWVKPTKGAYDPSAPLADQEREGEAEEAEGLSDDDEDEEAQMKENEEKNDDAAEDNIILPLSATTTTATADLQNDHGMMIAGSESESEPASSADSFAGFDSAPESDAEPTLTQHQRELEAEAAGITFSETLTKAGGQPVKGILKRSRGDEARQRAAKKRREEEEELERRKMMMGRKKRKVLDKMLYSNRQKEGEAQALRAKRRKIEAGKAKVET